MFIRSSNVAQDTKAIMNLIKLCFYMFFYFHLVTCGMYNVININAPMSYILDTETGTYLNQFGIELTDDNGDPVQRKGNLQWIYKEDHTFRDQSWNRKTPEDGPDWQEFNEGWDSQNSMWYTPLDWVDFPSQRLFKTETDKGYRYITLLYYSVLDMFCNELGPVNTAEMSYFIGTLLLGSMINALIFGDITFLISSLSKKDNEFQERLDSANGVMT